MSDSRYYLIEDKERADALFNKIMNADLRELSQYLISDLEEERWLAQIRLNHLKLEV